MFQTAMDKAAQTKEWTKEGSSGIVCPANNYSFWFFSKLIVEEGPGIPGVKDSPVMESPFYYDNCLFSKDFISAFIVVVKNVS